jgi:signal peptidase I
MMKFLYLCTLVSAGVVVALCALVFMKFPLPFIGSFDVRIVQSGSMEPTIPTGSVVFVRREGTYAVGDVITFRGGSSIPTTHRIVGSETHADETAFMTKGDANEDPDTNPVHVRDIMGKVLWSAPYVGFIIDFARKPLGFALLIVLPALLVILDEAEKIWREFRRLRAHRDPYVSLPVQNPDDTAIQFESRGVFASSRRYVDIRRTARTHVVQHSSPVRVARYGVHTALKSIGVIFVVHTLAYGAATVGSTIAYFADSESLLGNRLSAAALDFTVTQTGNEYSFTGTTLDTPFGELEQVVVPSLGSDRGRYELSVETGTSSALCNLIVAEITAPFVYTGTLASLTASNTLFEGPWSMALSLSTSTENADVCPLTLVYTAHHTNQTGEEGGYVDEERVPLLFSALPDRALRIQTVSASDTPQTLSLPDEFVSTTTTTATKPDVDMSTTTEPQPTLPAMLPLVLQEGLLLTGTTTSAEAPEASITTVDIVVPDPAPATKDDAPSLETPPAIPL